LIYKGDLSVKSNSYLITLKDADPKGLAFEMLKGVKSRADFRKNNIVYTGEIRANLKQQKTRNLQICKISHIFLLEFIYSHDGDALLDGVLGFI
jgi:hypothetical protein